MSDPEINQVIAKWMGWDWDENSAWTPEGRQHDRNRSPLADEPDGKSLLPDYANDLNVMREAEKNLGKELFGSYQGELEHETYGKNDQLGWQTRDLILATSRQRAEALLRALGICKEAPCS